MVLEVRRFEGILFIVLFIEWTMVLEVRRFEGILFIEWTIH